MAKIKLKCVLGPSALLALALLAACGSEDKGTATNDNATAQCTPPAKVLCDCEAGPSGTRTCQIDGSWSVCACNAAASGGSGGSGALPTGGMSAGNRRRLRGHG
jgi:hypothetical protein